MPEAPKAIPPRPPPPPPSPPKKPILAGRFWIVVFIIGGLGLIANPPFNQFVINHVAPAEDLHTDSSTWKLGGEANVRVTVITADSTRLACANAATADGKHCAFSADKLPWPRPPDAPVDDNGQDIIQPYRTSPDNVLILVAGLWSIPEVAMRLHREPPGSVQTKRLGRFDIVCRAKFIGKFDEVGVRWDVGANWQTERNAWVAKPLSCTVINS